MSYPIRHTVDITTATGGAGTGYLGPCRGVINSIGYATGTLATSADLTITMETSKQAVLTAADVAVGTQFRPVAAGTTTTGAASSLTEVPIYAADERVKIVIAQGGNTKTGTFYAVVV